MKFSIFATAVMAVLLYGCSKPKPAIASRDAVVAMICGDYQGQYDHGIEYVEIKTNGWFSKKYVRNGITNYVSDGEWKIERYQYHWMIEFSPFFSQNEIFQATRDKVADFQVEFHSFNATYYENEKRIWLSQENNWYITKQPTNGVSH